MSSSAQRGTLDFRRLLSGLQLPVVLFAFNVHAFLSPSKVLPYRQVWIVAQVRALNMRGYPLLLEKGAEPAPQLT